MRGKWNAIGGGALFQGNTKRGIGKGKAKRHGGSK
jgi:hypothetical protein